MNDTGIETRTALSMLLQYEIYPRVWCGRPTHSLYLVITIFSFCRDSRLTVRPERLQR